MTGSTAIRNNDVVLEDEVLRDGLQMESRLFELEEKIRVFNLLTEAGVKRIQVGSFVHPKIVPQMADTEELIRNLNPPHDVLITSLVLNSKGLERALVCGVPHVSISVSASDTHSRKNTNRSTADALSSVIKLIFEAVRAKLSVRAGVQCAFGCVYEGAIPEDKIANMARALVEAGAKEVNLADTTGMGNPLQVRSLIRRIREEFLGVTLSLHLHDTRGLGLANMLAGYEEGVGVFDVCAGGLGGCPFVKSAAGNVPTEDAAHMFEAIGVSTGVSIERFCKVVLALESLLGRQLPGRMNRVLNPNVA